MHINWFEIFAIILNFFILLALLNKFLFKPVLAAMEEREEKIEQTIEMAETKLKEAESILQEYENKVESIKEAEEDILNQASIEAREKRELMLEGFQEEIALKKELFERDFALEKKDFISKFRKFLADYTIRISRKLLEPLSDTKLEDKLFEALLETVKEIPEEIIRAEQKLDGGQVDIISSGEIAEDQAKVLTDLISKLTGKETFNFSINEDLLYGYQLVFNTFTLNENLDFYLKDMEEEIEKHQKLN